MKVIIVLGFSFLLIAIEGWLEEKISVSGLLGSREYGLCPEVKKYGICFKAFVRKVWKIVADVRGHTLCISRSSSGYQIYIKCWHFCCTYDFHSTCIQDNRQFCYVW